MEFLSGTVLKPKLLKRYISKNEKYLFVDDQQHFFIINLQN